MALVLIHEEKMREFLEVWRQAEAANVRLPATSDTHYQSLQHLLWHVLNSSGQHGAGGAFLDRLLRWWRVPLAAVETADMEPELYTPEMHDWTDAMLEHAVMHPVRHSFQLRELLAAQAQASSGNGQRHLLQRRRDLPRPFQQSGTGAAQATFGHRDHRNAQPTRLDHLGPQFFRAAPRTHDQVRL